MKKGQFDFVWIFALIVGGAILALAIYGAMNFGETTELARNSEISKSLSVLIDPMQAGFAESSFGKITFRQDTRINNYCFEDFEDFGKNQISIQTLSKKGDWGVAGAENAVKNKYIFSEERVEGTEFFVFSSSFNFPYKVSDVVVLTSMNYCFVDAPDEIVDDVELMGLGNVFIEESLDLDESECLSDFVRVCFGSGSNCDVTVYGTCTSNCLNGVYDEGRIVKRGGDVYYVEGLIYAGIFSSVENYNCNIERLLYRSASIARVLYDKADFMSVRGCNSNLQTDLSYWRSLTLNATTEDLSELRILSVLLNKRNRAEDCGLWD